MASIAATTITRHRYLFRPVRAASARPPLTLFTANQPMPAVSEFSPAGRKFPRKPNPRRLSTIWHWPVLGPQLDNTPWETAPSPVPRAIARTASQNVKPKNNTQMTPTKTVANSMFGDVQVQSSWIGRPCRSASGILRRQAISCQRCVSGAGQIPRKSEMRRSAVYSISRSPNERTPSGRDVLQLAQHDGQLPGVHDGEPLGAAGQRDIQIRE